MSISWNNIVRALSGALLLAWLGVAPQAQTGSIPQTVAYSGFLRDNLGDPVSGTVNLTFELFDAASGGTALWTESHTDVSVAGGVFGVDLGSVTSFESAGLAFDKPLFLAITVDGELMDSRLPLTSAPYALRSGEGITNVSVQCPAESIQQAIDRAPAGGRLIVTISGICEETVNLERDRVTFHGAAGTEPDVKGGAVPPDGIRGNTNERGALTIDGASDIVVQGLLLESVTPGPDERLHGLRAYDNGSVSVLNTLMRDSWAGAFASNGGFIQIFDSKIEGNSNYGILLTDGGLGWLQDSNIDHDVSATGDGDEAAIGAFRSTNVRLRGENQIINAGDNGQYSASNPDASNNDDNGLSIYLYHGVQMHQDSGHTLFVGGVDASNQVQVSLRDPELVGDINISNNSLMDMRTNSTGGQELAAREIQVGNSSYLGFGRNDMELKATQSVEVSNHSRLGLFRDTITAEFGSASVDNHSELQVRGTTTFSGGVDVGNGSSFNSWQQTNTVSMTELNLNRQSQANLRGAVTISGDLGAYGKSVVDLFDGNIESTTDKTVVDVGGNLSINEGSHLNITNTAVMNVTGDAGFAVNGTLNVSGFFEDPPECDVCTVDNASELNVSGSGGLQVGRRSGIDVTDGAVVTAKSMNVGPFGFINLSGASEIEIQLNGNPGSIEMFNFNQVFWGGESEVIGNITIGANSNINIDGAGNAIDGGFNVNGGRTPGVLNIYGSLDVESGDIDCNGEMLDSGTVNGSGNVTFSGGGSFVNCPAP